jgi:hypothetical protein
MFAAMVEGFSEVSRRKEMMPVADSTMATAIVSPSARPSPSIAAETMPGRPKGSTARRIISQRVAPSARAASSCSAGACRNTSRQIAVMIGRIMTASTSAAVRIVRPVPLAVPPKNGIQPRYSLSHTKTGCAAGASTPMPQRPKTTLGTAASRSTMYPST